VQQSGRLQRFCQRLGTVLGLKIARGELWALSNSDGESALIHYDLATGRVIRKYAVAAGHLFNDLTIARNGAVYVTDTRAGALWRLARGAAALAQLPGRFEAANGITISADEDLLFVSTFPDGISVVETKTHTAAPIARPTGLCLGAIDGVYFHKGTLIAIQNGFMTPRVIRMFLADDSRSIQRFEVIERRNLLFEGVTTGVVVGNDFFYMANIQDDRTAEFNPITILRVRL
jgi:hypothetical protein